MTINYKFVWIDDDDKRASEFIGAFDGTFRHHHVETKLEVIKVTENLLEDLDNKTNEWTKDPPNLILLDHNFSKVNKRLFHLHGSALAHLLRIQLVKTPIVCLSGQTIESDDFDIEDLSEYTYLFDVTKIYEEANLELLFAIANDFPLLCFQVKHPVRQLLVDVLKPPEYDRDALLRVLPEEFESKYVHGISPHRIARWILNVFMRRQGFLYNTLETATFIGLTEKAFREKVQGMFEDARYRGPFSTEANPLWWGSALSDVLYEALPKYITLSPQYAGRMFHGIVEDDYSRCAETGLHTPAPDVVAYKDATKYERCAVLSRYTIPESVSASSILGFSTRLMIRNKRRGGK